MNARLIKETRDLLPILAGTLPLIVVPQLIWPPAGFGYFALGLACVLMAGSSFGSEFQHRTLTLLLSQPIARSVLWREKMLVLGGAMLVSLIAVVACLLAYCPVIDREGWLALLLIPLCAFCGAPYWTLLLRHGIGGMAFAVAIPSLLMVMNALVTERLFGDERWSSASALILVIYCALVYCLGYSKFKRLQALDGPSQELVLPAGLEAFFVRPLTRIGARFQSPFATLLKKEFRLQQISFLLAGLFLLFALAGACLIKHHRNLGEGIVVADCFIYVMILPLIAGATSVAEEKGWGIAEWHLTLPPSSLKQWSAKMLAALSTSLALGLLLPTAIFLAGQSLLGQPVARSFPSAPELLCWPLGSLLLTSIAVYAASISNNTLRAILAAFGIVAAGYGACFLTGAGAIYVAHHLASPTYFSSPSAKLIPLLIVCGLFLLLCVVQWLAWSNFQGSGVSALEIVGQLAFMLFSVALITLGLLTTLFLLTVNIFPRTL